MPHSGNRKCRKRGSCDAAFGDAYAGCQQFPFGAGADVSYRRLSSDPQTLAHDGTGHLRIEAGFKAVHVRSLCCLTMGCIWFRWTSTGEASGCSTTNEAQVRSTGTSC